MLSRCWLIRCLVWLLVGSAAWSLGVAAAVAEIQNSEWPVLGHDVLWRPRDSVTYYLESPKGGTIHLSLKVRDMNIYLQGSRPAICWVIGPQGQTLLYERIADDRIVSGNFRFKEGLADLGTDFRYRAWVREHRNFYLLKGKERAGEVDHPERLSARAFKYTIPDAGSGLYRVVILSCWDHWVSLEIDRKLDAAISPGTGPLSLRAGGPFSPWAYLPSGVKDVVAALSEEVEPFNRSFSLKSEKGNLLAKTTSKLFYRFAVLKAAPINEAIQIHISEGPSTACLFWSGAPALFAASAPVAKKFNGGLLFQSSQRAFPFPQQVILSRWAQSIPPASLLLPPITKEMLGSDAGVLGDQLEAVNSLLANQNKDKDSMDFGRLPPRTPEVSPFLLLSQFASSKGLAKTSPSLVQSLLQRLFLACCWDVSTLNGAFRYDNELGRTAMSDLHKVSIGDVGISSAWFPFMDALPARAMVPFTDEIKEVAPAEVVDSWKQLLDMWALARGLVTQGECSNQWCDILSGLADVYKITGNPKIREILQDRIAVMTDGQGLGRVNPLTPAASLHSEAGYGFASDAGMMGSGVLSEIFGFDAEYDLEQVLYIQEAWKTTKSPALIQWWNSDYDLKTHLSLPWKAKSFGSAFPDIVSPTDLNFRTPFYTHKSNLPKDAADQVNFSYLWATPQASENLWPCAKKEPFIKSIDNRFHFINTPTYYAIVYTGETLPDWQAFEVPTFEVEEQSHGVAGGMSLKGYDAMGYGGRGRKASKPGGLSAVYLKNFGVGLLSQNLDVPYTNTVWGRRKTPVSSVWGEMVDPYIVAAAYAPDPISTFNEKSGAVVKSERMLYADILSERAITFQPEFLDVNLQVRALDQVDLTELFESIPVIISERTLEFQMADGTITTVDPFKTSGDLSVESWTIRSFDLKDATGAGMRVQFDAPVQVKLSKPVHYRPEVPYAAAVQVILQPSLKSGEVQKMGYQIQSLKSDRE